MALSPVRGLNPLLASVTSAVVTAAGVVAAGPGATAAMPSLIPANAEVVLAAATQRLDNPVQQLIDTARLATAYLFATYYNGGDVPTPGAGEANWPFAGLDQTGGDLLNYALYNNIDFGSYNAVGLLPQIVAAPSPALSQFANNTFNNAFIGFNAVLDAFSTLSDGLWNLPLELFNVAQLAFNGASLQDVLVALREAVVAPVTQAVDQFAASIKPLVDTFSARFSALSRVLPAVIADIAVSVATSVQAVLGQASAIGIAVIDDIRRGQIVDAVNTAVDGLLGPSGLPGTILNTTIGAGVQTGPILQLGDAKNAFTPSIRTSVQAGQRLVQNALTATPEPTPDPFPLPVASLDRAARAARVPAVAAVPADAAPAAAVAAASDSVVRGSLTAPSRPGVTHSSAPRRGR